MKSTEFSFISELHDSRTKSHSETVPYNRIIKEYERNHNSTDKIYYAHSIKYYGSTKEVKDIKYLLKLGRTIINPSDFVFDTDGMTPYLLMVKDCDAIYFRGETIGVIFEVLIALVLGKKVFSLESKKLISEEKIKSFSYLFFQSSVFDDDLDLIEQLFGQKLKKRLFQLINKEVNT